MASTSGGGHGRKQTQDEKGCLKNIGMEKDICHINVSKLFFICNNNLNCKKALKNCQN